MKKLTKILYIVFFLLSNLVFANSPNTTDKEVDKILTELSTEIKASKIYYSNLKEVLHKEIIQIKKRLVIETDVEVKVNLLIEKDILSDKLKTLEATEMSNISKIRYLKGLSIIKILYEKVLSLDHHFSSIATFNEISKISNPNNYQEFTRVKDLIKNKTEKKKGLNLTSLLGQNIYTSSIDMLVGLFNSNASPQEKEVELKKIECIMDFTLRINPVLNKQKIREKI